MKKKPLTAVSIFSGCGGFDWGAAQAGVKIIWANDNNPYASAAYRSLFPNIDFHEGDIRDIKKFPKADILIGCYPCTGFSEAAKRRAADMKTRRNLKDNDGNYLYREFLRALRQCAAIQELPSHIQVPGGLMAKYRVVGNAVPPPLAKALLKPVVSYMRKAKKSDKKKYSKTANAISR